MKKNNNRNQYAKFIDSLHNDNKIFKVVSSPPKCRFEDHIKVITPTADNTFSLSTRIRLWITGILSLNFLKNLFSKTSTNKHSNESGIDRSSLSLSSESDLPGVDMSMVITSYPFYIKENSSKIIIVEPEIPPALLNKITSGY